ncbi:MAG TPA: hypothetical protein VLV76_03805 [Candidatus Acidoferrum sp.]|nr:hypothetical protein [Candidatus Acidoferrum sp.]
MTGRSRALIIAAVLLLAACSTAPMNEPLKPAALNSGPSSISIGGYRSRAIPQGDTSDHLLVLLASSGGGSGIADAAEREKLQHIPTGLTIPDADVDALVAAGEKQVRDSKVLADFRASLVPPATVAGNSQ